MEVPIPGSDTINWTDVTVTFPSPLPGASPPVDPTAPPHPKGTGGCHVIPGDPTAYVVWRIHGYHPNALELIELFPSEEFPGKGLRLIFPDGLHPFSLVYKDETEGSADQNYKIYALTVSGIACFLNLKNFSKYVSGSLFSSSDLIALDVQSHSRITAVEATNGCLIIGHQEGSVYCYQLGVLDQSALGFKVELRDDTGIGRLWSLMSRGRTVGAVKDFVISELFGKKVLFVAHEDGTIQGWDFINHTRTLNLSVSPQDVTGSLCRFWIGDVDYEACQFYMAVLYDVVPDSSVATIVVHSLSFNDEESLTFSLESSVRYISLEKKRLVDVKLTGDKIWVLKEEAPMLYNLSHSDVQTKSECNYNLHEEFMAELLFQGTGHPYDDLIWTFLATFPHTKDQAPYIMSTVYLRRLLQPGICLSSALHATIVDKKKYLTDYGVNSHTTRGLKQELLSIIESQGLDKDKGSMLCFWNKFCSHFFHHWCRMNSPYGLFVDPSSGAVGLIRENSISLFRQVESFEMIMYGSSVESFDVKSPGFILPCSSLDCEILYEVMRCMRILSDQLGTSSASVFHECLVNTSSVPYEEIVFHLLKVLEGQCLLGEVPLSSQTGEDANRQKKQAAHKRRRRFSIDMLLSLNRLHAKAFTWDKVLDVVELYLENLIIGKPIEDMNSKRYFSINSKLLVQATSQIAKVRLEFAFHLLMLLGYISNVSAQVSMMQNDVSRIKLKIMPKLEDIVIHWHIVYFMGTTQTETPLLEDFNSCLSSLHIDKSAKNRSWDEKLGSAGFSLAYLLDFPFKEEGFVTCTSFPDSSQFINPIRNFCSWLVWGKAADRSSVLLHPSIEIACLLLRHQQYEAAENLLAVIEAHLSKNKMLSFQAANVDWCACLHLLGFCLVLRAQDAPNTSPGKWKIHEAVRCFFRVASTEAASIALQKLSFQTGFLFPGNTKSISLWRFFYYQWVMQFFEQYNSSEAACQFALASLEQVDDVLDDDNNGSSLLPEPPIFIRGRLWANIFKFAIDLNNYRDAYCAIISNPDEDSKYTCLRRFIIVLYEKHELKILCNGELPFVGLVEKVEQELVWKAERSAVSSNPNLYKLLYAFEMHRSKWRKAASYMYRCSSRLRKELNFEESHQLIAAFPEILFALSAAINALQLVHHSHAWIDSQHENYLFLDKSSPNKRPRKALIENSSVSVDVEPQKPHYYLDIELLEKEYVFTSAQYLLCLVHAKCSLTATQPDVVNAVDALVEANFYEMAFTVLLKFLKGSQLKRELEKIFVALSQKCCSNNEKSSVIGKDALHALLLTSSDDASVNGKIDLCGLPCQPLTNFRWETLELYLEKYRSLHPRLPVIVAETLLYTYPRIELPLWLVHIFKGGRRATSWGMTGQESDPATLFRLYVDYGCFAEATNLLIEYLEAFVSQRPSDLYHRKRMSAVWFPYVAVERLWCNLEELRSSGHIVDQCDRFKSLLQGMMQKHLHQLKVDSEDALASAAH